MAGIRLQKQLLCAVQGFCGALGRVHLRESAFSRTAPEQFPHEAENVAVGQEASCRNASEAVLFGVRGKTTAQGGFNADDTGDGSCGSGA